MKKERTRSQVARGARNKGSGAERVVAKLLGLCLFGDEDIFTRTPSSGGLRWKKNVAGTRGDIVAPGDVDWPFSIEVKNSEQGNWDLYQILFNHGPIINDWWEQACKDAHEVTKNSDRYVYPILIFKRNNVPFLLVIEEACFNKNLGNFRILTLPKNYFYLVDQGIYIMPLAAFLMSNKTLSIEELLDKNESLIQRHLINPLRDL